LFAFTDYSGREFVIQLTDAKLIQEAMDILSGKQKNTVHVMGKIKKSKAEYNPNWSFFMGNE